MLTFSDVGLLKEGGRIEISAIDLFHLRGLLLITDATTADVRHLVDQFGLVTEHPHAARDGATMIHPRPKIGVNERGFTRRHLDPHTDGTAADRPADLVSLHCLRPAETGGEAVLVDGRRVLARLNEQGFGVRAVRDSVRLVYHRGGAVRSVFEAVAPARYRIRYRDDELAAPHSELPGLVGALRAAVAHCAVSLRLRAGQGYIVDNGRWLHGRVAFSGERRMLRYLAVLRPESAYVPGFTVPSDEVAPDDAS